METGINRTQIVNELGKSLHGKLAEYQPIINTACRVDPEFLAHMIAWDFTNGQIKDTKIALPVLTIANREFPDELVENSLAHLALQPARELLKALRFSIEVGTVARRQRRLERVIHGWLDVKERVPEKWGRAVARQRRADGGTSYGIGLQWGADREWDGIVVVGDGAENQPPMFHDAYRAYLNASGRTPPVYLFKTFSTEGTAACARFEGYMKLIGHPVQVFDVSHGNVDYYSIPNLVQTMNANSFALTDKIMACPLVTLEQVLPGFLERKGVTVNA